MDWHDQSGEIYLHAISTVLINSGLGSAGPAVLSEPGFFYFKAHLESSSDDGLTRAGFPGCLEADVCHRPRRVVPSYITVAAF